MVGPRILIVEDEFLIRMTLSEALAEEGFDVVEAGSGEEAVRLMADRAPIALLLTDVQLSGGLDGLALARRMRNEVPGLPVIFMTGRPDSAAGGMVSDRDVTIAKPYLIADVCAAARRLIAAAI
jgi:DNA-binding response OmpR family regulator